MVSKGYQTHQLVEWLVEKGLTKSDKSGYPLPYKTPTGATCRAYRIQMLSDDEVSEMLKERRKDNGPAEDEKILRSSGKPVLIKDAGVAFMRRYYETQAKLTKAEARIQELEALLAQGQQMSIYTGEKTSTTKMMVQNGVV